MNSAKWRDPEPEELETLEFNAVWNCIKKWDIATGLDKDDAGNDLYSGATGNHVVAILDALRLIERPRVSIVIKGDIFPDMNVAENLVGAIIESIEQERK